MEKKKCNQYENLNHKIQNVQKRINILHENQRELEGEYKYFIDSELNEKILKWEKEFEIQHGNVLTQKLLPVVNEYGSKQAYKVFQISVDPSNLP